MRSLRRRAVVGYSEVLGIHRRLFPAVYPWAGEDCRHNAPHLAITKAGYNNLFAHPQDVQRAAGYALQLALDPRPVIPASAREPLGQVPYAAVQLTGGPFAAQCDAVHAHYLSLSDDRLLKVYRQRAGPMAHGRGHGRLV